MGSDKPVDPLAEFKMYGEEEVTSRLEGPRSSELKALPASLALDRDRDTERVPATVTNADEAPLFAEHPSTSFTTEAENPFLDDGPTGRIGESHSDAQPRSMGRIKAPNQPISAPGSSPLVTSGRVRKPAAARSGSDARRTASDARRTSSDARRTGSDARRTASNEPRGNQASSDEIEQLRAVVKKTRQQLKAFYQHYMERGGSKDVTEETDIEALSRRIETLSARLEGLERQGPKPAYATGAYRAIKPSSDHPEVTGSLEDNPLFLPASADGSARAQRIDRFLKLMVERGASDLHLTVGLSPMFRDSGDIEPLRYRRLTQDDWTGLIKPIAPPRIWAQYDGIGDADFAYEFPGVGRFRVNLFRQHRGGGAVFRVIPTKIMTIDQLGLPHQTHRIPKIRGGLILVTGPTGSGKSTTLAAIVNEINEQRGYHIITLEDPIEFVHENKKSVLHQREIGTHSLTFTDGLRDAVREDPNLLLVGEMRDAETIRLALESAEKGLLVFGTLHTNNAAKTVDRIVNTFPSEEQETIRSILADTIRAILAQQLMRRRGGGRVAAVEILFGSPALTNLIREGKTHQITGLIQTGRRQGMISMDDSLKVLLDGGIITSESAREKAIDKSAFADSSQAEAEEQSLKQANASTSAPKK